MGRDHLKAEDWLRRAVRSAPRPLPPERFVELTREAERAGFTRDEIADAVDEWLNYGYCRIVEPVSGALRVLPEGEAYFYTLW